MWPTDAVPGVSSTGRRIQVTRGVAQRRRVRCEGWAQPGDRRSSLAVPDPVALWVSGSPPARIRLQGFSSSRCGERGHEPRTRPGAPRPVPGARSGRSSAVGLCRQRVVQYQRRDARVHDGIECPLALSQYSRQRIILHGSRNRRFYVLLIFYLKLNCRYRVINKIHPCLSHTNSFLAKVFSWSRVGTAGAQGRRVCGAGVGPSGPEHAPAPAPSPVSSCLSFPPA